MKCPYCGKEEMYKTLESRPQSYGVKRRKRCIACGRNFATVEFAEYSKEAVEALARTRKNIEARYEGD